LAEGNSSNNVGPRERFNSAFKKYDSKEINAEAQPNTEPQSNSFLKKGHGGEPSFGANSKHNISASGGHKQSEDLNNDQPKGEQP